MDIDIAKNAVPSFDQVHRIADGAFDGAYAGEDTTLTDDLADSPCRDYLAVLINVAINLQRLKIACCRAPENKINVLHVTLDNHVGDLAGDGHFSIYQISCCLKLSNAADPESGANDIFCGLYALDFAIE